MRKPAVRTRTVDVRLVLMVVLLVLGAAAGQARAESPGTAGSPAAHIAAVMKDPQVASGIRAWGVSQYDLAYGMASLTPDEQLRTSRMLAVAGRVGQTDAAEQQAHYLVLVTLMREARLFASVLSTGMR